MNAGCFKVSFDGGATVEVMVAGGPNSRESEVIDDNDNDDNDDNDGNSNGDNHDDGDNDSDDDDNHVEVERRPNSREI